MSKIDAVKTKFIDERSLISRISQGDRDAFCELYTHYLDDIYQYLYLFTKSRDTCEEIIQNLFLKIWQRREKLTEVSSFRQYIYRSSKNMLIDEIRKKQTILKAQTRHKSIGEENIERADGKIIFSEYSRITRAAIDYLPAKRKKIVEMHTLDEYSFDEIAKIMSISKSVVKKQLYAGMMFVRNYLKKHGELDT